MVEIMMPGPARFPDIPIIQPVLPPRPEPQILIPGTRAAAVWPARTWTDAEKTTATMMNGVRDQLNDMHTSQGNTTATLLPTIYAKLAGTLVAPTDWTQLDFQYLPALAAHDTVIVDMAFNHGGVNPTPRMVMYMWNSNASYTIADFTLPTSGAASWRFILRRHPNSDQYFYRTVMGGDYAVQGGIVCEVYQVYDWKASAIYMILGPLANAYCHWSWTVTVFPGGN